MPSRRVPGEGSIYQRKTDGRWVGVVDLGVVNGKRVRKTVTAATLKDLRPKFRALQAQIGDGVVPDAQTVEAWMAHWMTHIATKGKRPLRPSTQQTYQGYIDKWIVPHLGRRRLDRLQPEHIQALYSAMEDAGRSDATRRQVHAILRRALEIAKNQRKITYNPAAMVDPPAVGQGSHGKFTLAEAHALLAHVSGHPDRARWIVALLAGLRQGEALGLRWDDVDVDAGVIVVERAAQRIKGKGIELVPVKSKAARRVVPMVAPVRAALAMAPRDGEFVFGGDKPRDPRRDWQAWKDLLAEAKVPDRPLHAARATTASLLEEAGVSSKQIADILGHSQVQVTERHYIQSDLSMSQKAMGKLDDLVKLEPLKPLAAAPASPPAL